MATRKTIAWESWNAKLEDLQAGLVKEVDDQELSYTEIENINPTDMIYPDLFSGQPKIIHTPLGPYPEDSLLKPSDRWDCWTAHTNFDITTDMADKLETEVGGIEALKVIGRYSFFIGVAKLFDIAEVRKDVETLLCGYTEQEVLDSKEVRVTVDLVKQQLESKKYWSLFVSPEGEVEYVVSDEMDKGYLDGLNGLLEMKSLIGGIILRGSDG
jgi:hypothetical protein